MWKIENVVVFSLNKRDAIDVMYCVLEVSGRDMY